ncbi:hypothetical protein DH2020_047583 [Rehmannia glutinosa]|uniref:Late embryogenesis abundant protein LEA-2 subgroup domain-containing protein n=1 Tax=Rehmannia glutinosa TaxID=99300 RepID=A0ABR0U850_REHGL
MGVGMHVKSDSEVTSIDASTPPRSPRRPLYYVQSPSHSQNNDLEKMSYGSSPFGSPAHHHFQYHCSPIHHSRESSTSRFSASLKNPRNFGNGWRLMQRKYNEVEDGDEEGDGEDEGDGGGHVMRIFYRNPGTFFGVHVTSTPLELHYLGLKVASGHIKKFYQSRKSDSKVIAVVQGQQVPLYGGMPLFIGAKDHLEGMSVPLNLTFVMRSRAYILGRLVKTKFYRRILCEVTLRGNHLGKPLNLTESESCVYH